MSSRIDNFDEQVTKALLALEGFNQARVKVFQAMQKRPLVAFEYVNARDKDLPDSRRCALIAEGQWGPRVDLTANVAWTLQGAGTVHVARAAAVGRRASRLSSRGAARGAAQEHRRARSLVHERHRHARPRHRVPLAEAHRDVGGVIRRQLLHCSNRDGFMSSRRSSDPGQEHRA